MLCYAKSLQSCLTLWPQRWQHTRLPHPWDSPGKNTGVGCHFLLQCMKVKRESEVAQSCPTPSDPMDCSPPGSSIHGIFQASVLEWGAIAFSGSVTKSCLILWDLMDCSKPGSSILNYLPEFAQIHAHWVVILSNHLILYYPFFFFYSFPQLQSFLKWVSSSYQVAKVSELQFHKQSFQ